MLIEDTLLKLYNELGNLDSDKMTLVKEDEKGVLTYYQIGKVLQLPFIRLYYYSGKKFKYGLLTPNGLTNLRSDILKILQDGYFKQERLLFVPKKYSIGVLTLVSDNGLARRGPQEIYELKLVNITNRFYADMLMRYGSSESKLLLKMKKVCQ